MTRLDYANYNQLREQVISNVAVLQHKDGHCVFEVTIWTHWRARPHAVLCVF